MNYCILFPFINIFYLLYKLPLFEIHFHFFHICISMVYFNFKDIYHYNYVASAYVDTLPLPTMFPLNFGIGFVFHCINKVITQFFLNGRIIESVISSQLFCIISFEINKSNNTCYTLRNDSTELSVCSIFNFNNLMTDLFWSLTKKNNFFRCLWLIDIKSFSSTSYDSFVIKE